MKLDEGYLFGLGFFETVAVERGVPLFLDWHLERLRESLDFLGIPFSYETEDVEKILKEKGCPPKGVLKIVASGENVLFLTRENHYGKRDYEKGFRLEYSRVLRNETSPLTYRKSLNYGDCILEKRAAAKKGIEERIFKNTRGELSEGTVSNIFFVKEGVLYTPDISSGLLPGILRRWVIEEGEKRGEPVRLCRIRPEDAFGYEECFVTNSLMGIMPVRSLENREFAKRTTTEKWMERYRAYVEGILQKRGV